MNKIKVGIVGGAGYTAGELLRILINHPGTEISFIQSESQAGKPVQVVHQDLFFINGLNFTGEIFPEADVYFLCKGHGESAKILKDGSLPRDKCIIDLSQDFRIAGSETGIQSHYGDFIYGLPEMNRERIRNAKNVANPGCFATSIQLGLLPMAEKQLLTSDVHVSAITGSTGAGQSLSATSHFTWRNNNLSVYKAFNHQHLSEIRQSLSELQKDFKSRIHFIPYRGNFTRGIIAALYLESDLQQQNAQDMYAEFYRDHPFVNISGTNINLKQVVNSNHCLLYVEKTGDQLLIISIIDNLLKGASGQAVQNMNLMFGIDEKTGLNLKGSAF
jgi:N-acetyl-gamma-glutamyl-phosphate reductase